MVELKALLRNQNGLHVLTFVIIDMNSFKINYNYEMCASDVKLYVVKFLETPIAFLSTRIPLTYLSLSPSRSLSFHLTMHIERNRETNERSKNKAKGN